MGVHSSWEIGVKIEDSADQVAFHWSLSTGPDPPKELIDQSLKIRYGGSHTEEL